MTTASLSSFSSQAPGIPVSPSALKVRTFQKADLESWDRFVYQHPGGTFFHQTAWMRVIERTFDHKAEYVVGEREGRVVAIAPLFRVLNWMVGKCLVSSPLAAYGGILAEDAEAENAVLEHLKNRAREQQVDYLELRNPSGGTLPGFVPNTRYAGFSMALKKDPEALLKGLPKDIRYMIRKADKAELRIQRGPELLDEFYRLFTINMRRLGTPVFPRSLFVNLLEEYGKQIDVLIVYAGSQPVASAVSFLFRDTMHPYYIGGVPVARDLAANNFLWWELMKFAAQSGMSTFDFGRSKKGTGAYAFKKKWDPTITDLDYQVFLVKRKTAPNFSPANPKFGLATQVWSRLPLFVTNRLGPRIVRWIP